MLHLPRPGLLRLNLTASAPLTKTSMSASLPPLIPTADLCDDYPDCVPFRPSGLPLLDYGGVKHFQGHAVTVRCFQDNSLAAKVLDEPGMSRVLVVDGQGSLACALFGDMMASKAVKNGWAGVVVNGAGHLSQEEPQSRPRRPRRAFGLFRRAHPAQLVHRVRPRRLRRAAPATAADVENLTPRL
jgi:hypothetical protein